MADPIICDTSVWLYLGRIGQVELLPQLYEKVYTTEMVCRELDIGRLTRFNTIDPRTFSWIQFVQPTQQEVASLPANRLGPGEQSVVAYAQTHNLSVVGLDDRQARVLAQQLGLRVIGSVGILLKAKEAGLLLSIRPLLEQMQQEGFYISDVLFTYALQKAKEK